MRKTRITALVLLLALAVGLIVLFHKILFWK